MGAQALRISPSSKLRIAISTARTMDGTEAPQNPAEWTFVDNGPYLHQLRQELLAAGFVHYETGAGASPAPRDVSEWQARREPFLRELQQRQAAEMDLLERRHMDGKKAKEHEVQEALAKGFESFVKNAEERARTAATAAAKATRGGRDG